MVGESAKPLSAEATSRHPGIMFAIAAALGIQRGTLLGGEPITVCMEDGGVRREHLHPGTLNSFCLELRAGGNPGEMEPRRTGCDFRGAPAPGHPQGGSWGPALV